MEPIVAIHVIDWIMVSKCSYPRGIKNLSDSEPSTLKLSSYHSRARILDDVNGKGSETLSSYSYFLHFYSIYLENLLKADYNAPIDSSAINDGIARVTERYHTYKSSDILLKSVVEKLKMISSALQ
jgi:hypothetical protein